MDRRDLLKYLMKQARKRRAMLCCNNPIVSEFLERNIYDYESHYHGNNVPLVPSRQVGVALSLFTAIVYDEVL